MDFVITQDFTGVSNKREMEQYLHKYYDFVLKGKAKRENGERENYSYNDKERDKEESVKIISDNNKTVCRVWLTWVYDGVRAKMEWR